MTQQLTDIEDFSVFLPPFALTETGRKEFADFEKTRSELQPRILSDIKAGMQKSCYTRGRVEATLGRIKEPNETRWRLLITYNWKH